MGARTRGSWSPRGTASLLEMASGVRGRQPGLSPQSVTPELEDSGDRGTQSHMHPSLTEPSDEVAQGPLHLAEEDASTRVLKPLADGRVATKTFVGDRPGSLFSQRLHC